MDKYLTNSAPTRYLRAQEFSFALYEIRYQSEAASFLLLHMGAVAIWCTPPTTGPLVGVTS